MDKAAAQALVRKTLGAPFDKGRFVLLLKNMLNKFDESKAFHAKGYVKEKFKKTVPVIKTYERVGTYTDSEDKKIDLLVVYLQKENSIERARTSLRNFVADYLKQRGMKDAALVGFVAPNGADWRFSFVKMEYKFNDKGKVKEEFTPARRYSFLVGENENSHTAQSRLLPILLNDEVNPVLEELEAVFSVEPVTREFFEKYRGLFLQFKESLDAIVKKDAKIKKDFTEKGVETDDFIKKLLGQIVFLYFLQKKGWFGVKRGENWGAGSKHFLRELFEKKHGNYNNFFNDLLEPLFYNTLALERTKDWADRFNCRIPFLNGGLFDPLNGYDWVDTDILFPDDIFSNDRKTKEGDVGDGILDIFDRYNFTVKEDEPLEKEVAVDPEMLGKVFENLLSERSSTGTYYTPREIVHYMCQESLANYLETELDGKINKENIDTLVKYGEVVVEHDSRVASAGRETKTYAFKLPQSVRKQAGLIDQKLAEIRVCDPAVGSGAFPVGMMNEIIKTRNALTPHFQSRKERSPYHFKREAIQDCLYGVDIDPGAVEIAKLRLWLSLIVDEEEREKIQPLPNLDYKIVQGNSLMSVEKNVFNQSLFSRLEELKPRFFNETSVGKKQEYKEVIDELISEITDGHKEFDFEVYFSEIFHKKQGFDVVIGNPPYIQLQKEGGKLGKLYQTEGFVTFTKRGDIYQLFYEKGLRIAREERGLLTFITSNSWQRAEYGEKLRQFFSDKHSPLQLIDMGKDVFDNVIVDSNILLVRNGKGKQVFKAVDMDNIAQQTFPPDRRHWVTITPQGANPWNFLPPLQQSIQAKIERLGTPLKDWDVVIYRGVTTGCNAAFIIDQTKRDELIQTDPRNEEIIKPVLRGRDIQRYQARWAGLWLIYTRRKISIKNYPAVYEHLSRHRDRLSKKAGANKWYELQASPSDKADSLYSKKEKLVWIELVNRGRFAYDTERIYCEATTFIMTGSNIKYLCAFLNSKIAHWFLAQISPTSGMGVLRWKKIYVGNDFSPTA